MLFLHLQVEGTNININIENTSNSNITVNVVDNSNSNITNYFIEDNSKADNDNISMVKH